MGGSSKQTIGYRWHMGMHLVLCLGPIDKITKIVFGDKVAWEGDAGASSATPTRISINQPKLFGGDKSEGGVVAEIDVLSGHPDQGINDYLADKIGSDLLPAYRGVASLVIRQGYIGTSSYCKPPAIEAQRIYIRADGQPQWYSEKAAIWAGAEGARYDDVWRYRVVSASAGGAFGIPAEYISPDYDDAGWSTGPGGFGSVGLGSDITVGTVIPAGETGKAIWLRKTIQVGDQALNDSIKLTIWHDDGAAVWWNGVSIELESISYYESSAVIPQELIIDQNVLVLQVLDGIPGGGPSNIFAGVTIEIDQQSSYCDINPAHIIREILTDNVFGRGLPETEIGPTYYQVADQLYAEGLGLSFLWTSEAPIDDLISEVLRHIDAIRYEDPETGLQELKLIRADYAIDALPVLDPSNSRITSYELPSLSELANQVTIKYHNAETDTDSAITVQDTAAITLLGTTVNKTFEYPGIRTDRVATMVAQRDLAAASRPFSRGTVVTNRSVANIKPGDCFILVDPRYGIDMLVARCARRTDNGALNGEITIEWGEDVFSSDFSIFSQPPASGWVPPIGPPADMPHQTAFEIPYILLVERIGDKFIGSYLQPETGYVTFVGSEPANTNHLNYALFVYPSGTPAPTDELDAVEGDFAQVCTASADADPQDDEVFITAFGGPDVVPAGTLVLIGTGADTQREIAALSAPLNPGDTDVHLLRAVADTLPRPIPSGTTLYIVGSDYAASPAEYAAGETAELYARTTTGRADYPGPYTHHLVTIDERAQRPYPPANVRLGGAYVLRDDTPPISIRFVVEWCHRDRVTQSNQQIGWFEDADYGPESGVTYRVEIDCLDSDLDPIQINLIARTVAGTYTDIDLTGDDAPVSGTEYIAIRVYSQRAGLSCLQPYTAIVQLLRAPTDLAVSNITSGYGTNYGGSYGG